MRKYTRCSFCKTVMRGGENIHTPQVWKLHTHTKCTEYCDGVLKRRAGLCSQEATAIAPPSERWGRGAGYNSLPHFSVNFAHKMSRHLK